MKYIYELIIQHPVRIRELPSNQGQGYIHYLEDLKINDFLKNNPSLVRTRKWMEDNYPELLL
jgi:hypothetical protein